MQKNELFLLLLLYLVVVGPRAGKLEAQPVAPMQRVWLIANTTDVRSDSPFFDHLREAVTATRQRLHLIVSGDLIAGCGHGSEEEKKILRLLDVVKDRERAEMTIIPGDRDWNDSGAGGWACVRAIEKTVRDRKGGNIHWPLKDGCPGPETIEIHPFVSLMVLNTQWWNHPKDKPVAADAVCKFINEYDILEEIQDEINESQDRNILLAGHFPFRSLGKYGGYFPPKAYLLPPVIGSMRVAFHKHVGGMKDISNENFEPIRDRLESIAGVEENLIFISGHEAGQQIILHSDNYLINSGAPVKADFITKDRDALLARSAPGFIELEFYPDGEVKYRFLRYTGEGFSPEETGLLFQSPCQEILDPDIPVNSALVPCAKPEHGTIRPSMTAGDSVTVAAGPEYAANGVKRFFFGKHFREDWITPVKVPVMSLDNTMGGLFALEKGGGRQTKSLKLQTPALEPYVFRSVNKDPVAALDYDLRSTIIAAVTRDQTSSEHPYGALVVAPLLKELDILHATPHLYVMPDDPRLALYRPTFANMLGMLEERPADPDPGEPRFAGADRILKSFELFRNLYNDQHVRVEADEFARARLFDLFVGDWSKHEDNWKWAGFQKGDTMVYRPVPRDRDHVFSNLDGLLPWIADRPFGIPNIENFGYRIRDVRSLTFQARHMDRRLANELERQDWLDAAHFIQQRLSDESIRDALMELPPEIREISAGVLEEKLLARRKDLPVYAGRFYKLLAEKVDVVGTNKQEVFEVFRQNDGATTVRMLAVGSDGASGNAIYERTFHPEETKEIRLFGLQGADRFVIRGKAPRAIKLYVVGGGGNDVISDGSDIGGLAKKTLVLENDPSAEIDLGKEGRSINSWNANLYEYDRTRFTYNTYLPIVYGTFSSFNGFVFTAGVSFTRQSFTKPDFSSKHRISADISTLGNFSLSYAGRFRYVVHKWDLVLDVIYANPENYNYFFGIGNNTINDEELFRKDYYQVRYNSIRAQAGLQRDFWKKSSATFLLGYENNETALKENTILGDGDYFGADSLNLFKFITELEFDLRDHKVLPQRGFRFFARQELGLIRGEGYGISDLFFEFFASTRRRPITLALKGGYSNSFPEGEVPFYKLPTLGQNTGLRGFQRNRFTGKGRLYFNSELRIFLARINTPVLPFRLGLRGFFDSGKIIQPGEDVGEWHRSYGGGFYLVPVARSLTFSFLIGFSKEEPAVIGLQLGTNF